MTAKLRLITVPVSHYCEKARWALDRAGARYVEERHAPMIHWTSTLRHAKSKTVPVLLTPHGVLKDSTEILKHVDMWLDEPVRLYPHDTAQRKEVEELEDLFDEKLGPQARRWGYAWLTEDARLFRAVISQGLAGVERKVVDATHPAMRVAMRRAFHLDRPRVKDKTMALVREVFDVVASRLAKGTKWLVGDRFTAADLTFAALSAPVIAPPSYGAWLPGQDEIPEEMAVAIRDLRATPGGIHALRTYEDQRRVCLK